MAIIKNNNGLVDVGDLITLGQAIDWIKGYRLGAYTNIGSNDAWRQQQLVDLMKDGGGYNPMIEVSQSGTPIPAYVFYSEEAIANLSDPELYSLYKFASTTHPISAVKYWYTDEQWQSKPFVSVKKDVNVRWRGLRPDPYRDVESKTKWNTGPEMPLGKFGDPDTTFLNKEVIKTELTRPYIVSVNEDESKQSLKTWVWTTGAGAPITDTPKDYKITSTFRSSSSTGAKYDADIQNTTDISGSIKANWRTASSAGAKVGIGEKKSAEASSSSNLDIESTVASSWKRYTQSKSSRDFKEDSITEEITEKKYTDRDKTDINWREDTVTLSADEYYELYGKNIIARPNDPVPRRKDGKIIMIEGARVKYGIQTLAVQSRSSLVTETDYTGTALGSFFQGFQSSLPTSYTQLFVSNKNVSRTAPNAPSDQNLGDMIAFQEWLKRENKNMVGKIYNRLQSLNFVDRIWGEGDLAQELEIGEKADKTSKVETYRLISAPDDQTLKTYSIKPLDSITELEVLVFEQSINGKSIKEYVLERAGSEGKPVPEVEDSTTLQSLYNLSGRTEQVNSNGFYTLKKVVKNTSVDLANVNNVVVDFGKDVKTDLLILTNTPTSSGAVTVNNYDPKRDSITGEIFEDAAWSVDYSTNIITASLALDKEGGIQFEIDFVIPIDRFNKKNGRFSENRNRGYDLDDTLEGLQASTSSVDSSPFMKNSPDLQVISISPEADLLL